MKTYPRLKAILGVGLLAVGASTAAADPPDIKELLTQVDNATKAIKEVSYEAEFYGDGGIAHLVPKVKGKAKGREGPSEPQNQWRLEGAARAPNAKEDTPFLLAVDGKNLFAVVHDKKEFVTLKAPARTEQLLQVTEGRLIMREFLHETPFADELKGTAKHEGTKEIGGVECDVVYVEYVDKSHARWYFGQKDHLPRRVDRIIEQPQAKGSMILIVTNLNTTPKVTDDDFRLTAPEGYAVKTPPVPSTPTAGRSASTRPAPALALEPGAPAPEWELTTSDGTAVSLSSLKGNVVVLGFWASWSKAAFPSLGVLQKIHEQYKDKPVKVASISVWETGAGPDKVMKENNWTFDVLLKGDPLLPVYKVRDVPTVYVIDKDGVVLLGAAKDDASNEEKIRKAVEAGLEEAGG